jgi:hypothetical protein
LAGGAVEANALDAIRVTTMETQPVDPGVER